MATARIGPNILFALPKPEHHAGTIVLARNGNLIAKFRRCVNREFTAALLRHTPSLVAMFEEIKAHFASYTSKIRAFGW
jgi:hypothetical protein